MAIKLEVNQRIQICTSLSVADKDRRIYYPSRIEEDVGNAIFIAEPLDGSLPVFLRLGQEIQVVFNDDTGTYRFRTKVLERVTRNITLIKIANPETVEKFNRRDFFRLKVFIPVAFRILSDTTFKYGYPQKQEQLKKTILNRQITSDEADKHEGIIKDLSGGGALVAISDKVDLKKGDHLELWLPLGKEPLYLWGDVARVIPNPEATKWNRDVGIYFSIINERTRDSIIAHVLSLQRELLQKGALGSD
ncbi:MAG: flagellar brake domain-containing protein [Firmicutes bacterium]|nr:flagellar brake domain-containing protein [Bacillota bacterium]MDD4694205.1 flagellar brake domain-containing protein [Bacillota bacterium]